MLVWKINLLIWCGGIASAPPRPHRDVVTSQGVVRGYLIPKPPHFAYLGVPYARLTRRDRFKAPKAPRRWDGIFEATHRVRCPQPGAGTEDCLVVNVFSPERASSLPVLVLVHDNLHVGWGAFHPPTRLLERGFVIVTFNYRLGALGFLCLGVPDAPGNASLKDQAFAIYWVHKNVANFGGNPSDITVYGVGSGAACVELLLLSGAINGLVHKVLLESGSIISPLSITYDPLMTATNAALGLGYHGPDSIKDLLKFYSGTPAKKLVNASIFLPCVEKHLHNTFNLIEMDPIEMFEQGSFQKLPTLIAYTDMVGVKSLEDELKKFNFALKSFEHILPDNLEFENENAKEKVLDLIKGFYLGRDVTDENNLQDYIDYINDISFEYPIIKSALLHASKNPLPVYLMKFQSQGWNVNGSNLRILDYFYEKKLLHDERTAKQLVTLWSNFIKWGDPTPLTTSAVPVVWQPVNTEWQPNARNIRNIRGLSFGRRLMKMDTLVHDRIIFWDKIYKKFYRIHRGVNTDFEKQ